MWGSGASAQYCKYLAIRWYYYNLGFYLITYFNWLINKLPWHYAKLADSSEAAVPYAASKEAGFIVRFATEPGKAPE
jgi:hypothetical protein